MLGNFRIFVVLLTFVSTISVGCFAESTISPVTKAGCQSRCGNVTIRYPFGIGSADCFYNEWFEILCQNDRAYLRKYYGPDHAGGEVLQIDPATDTGNRLSINADASNMRFCRDKSEWLAGNLSGSSLYYGSNKLMLFGCGNVKFFDGRNDRKEYNHRGCTSLCDSHKFTTAVDDCYGINCCQTLVAYGGFSEYYLKFSNSLMGKNSCASVFLVDQHWHPKNASLFTDPSADLSWASVPVQLWWNIPVNMSSPGFGNNKNCVPTSRLSGVYWKCNCPCGFSGNPFLPDGCQDIYEKPLKECSSYLKKNLRPIVVGGISLLISILMSTGYLLHKAIK